MLYLCTLTSLLHLQPQKVGLRTTDCLRIVTLPLVEGIAAFIESVDLALTFLLIVCMLLQAVYVDFSMWSTGLSFDNFSSIRTSPHLG